MGKFLVVNYLKNCMNVKTFIELFFFGIRPVLFYKYIQIINK